MTKAQKIILLAAAVLIFLSLAWNSYPGGPPGMFPIMLHSFGIQFAVIIVVAGAAFIIAKKMKSGGKE